MNETQNESHGGELKLPFFSESFYNNAIFTNSNGYYNGKCINDDGSFPRGEALDSVQEDSLVHKLNDVMIKQIDDKIYTELGVSTVSTQTSCTSSSVSDVNYDYNSLFNPLNMYSNGFPPVFNPYGLTPPFLNSSAPVQPAEWNMLPQVYDFQGFQHGFTNAQCFPRCFSNEQAFKGITNTQSIQQIMPPFYKQYENLTKIIQNTSNLSRKLQEIRPKIDTENVSTSSNILQTDVENLLKGDTKFLVVTTLSNLSEDILRHSLFPRKGKRKRGKAKKSKVKKNEEYDHKTKITGNFDATTFGNSEINIEATLTLKGSVTEKDNKRTDDETLKDEQDNVATSDEDISIQVNSKTPADRKYESLTRDDNTEEERNDFNQVGINDVTEDFLEMINESTDIESNMFIKLPEKNITGDEIMFDDDDSGAEDTITRLLPDAFSIWKEKYRDLVQEEYSDTNEGAVEQKLLEIWYKIPSEHREKYYAKADEIVRKYKADLRRCNYMTKKKKRRKTSEQKPVVKKKRRFRVMKPKPLRVRSVCQKEDINELSEVETDDPENLDAVDGHEFDYTKALKETMTYNSPDKFVKKKLAKRRATEPSESTLNFSNENEIATGFLQDIMMVNNRCETDIEDHFNVPQDNLILNQGALDVSDLDNYLTGEDSFFEDGTLLCSEVEVETQAEIEDKEQKRKRINRERQREKRRLKRVKEDIPDNTNVTKSCGESEDVTIEETQFGDISKFKIESLNLEQNTSTPNKDQADANESKKCISTQIIDEVSTSPHIIRPVDNKCCDSLHTEVTSTEENGPSQDRDVVQTGTSTEENGPSQDRDVVKTGKKSQIMPCRKKLTY